MRVVDKMCVGWGFRYRVVTVSLPSRCRVFGVTVSSRSPSSKPEAFDEVNGLDARMRRKLCNF